jgi:hypothetical protein
MATANGKRTEKLMRTRTYRKSYNRNTSWRRPNPTATKTRPPNYYQTNAPAFNQPRNECQWRMASYRAVYAQFSGTAKNTFFSPTTANKWINYVNQGYRVYQFSQKDFTRFFGSQWICNYSPNTCFRWMRQKYGAGIKAVARGRTNIWLVAATHSVTARPFQNYTWK